MSTEQLFSGLSSDGMYELYEGGFFGQILRIALLLDVFTPLSNGPASAKSVAGACGASLPGISALLAHLCSRGVLSYQEDTQNYQLSPSAAAFLVRGQRTYAGDWFLANTDPAMWTLMQETIRTGQTAGYTLPWAQDAWLESYSPGRIPYSLNLWRSAGVSLGPGEGYTILDLASGCGIKTLAFARENRGVHVTCLDREPVLEVARDLAGRFGVEARTTFLAADLLADDFGTGSYDAALLGLITYILTPEQNRTVFEKTCQALKPGGKLVVDAIMAAERPSEWASRATLLNSAWNGGAAHSFREYEAWLKSAGFSEVVQHSPQLLSAKKGA